MFLYSLLEVSEKATALVRNVSIVAVALLLVLIVVLCTKNRKVNTKKIAFAGICVALSFVLSMVKIKPVQYGGSITLFSFVPILIYAYVFGPVEGFLVGFIHGLLNFIESPYILTPITFILDYLLPFSMVGIMGFFGKRQTKDRAIAPVVLGGICVFSARFFIHFLSGIIFFLQGAVWVTLPDWAMSNAVAYSFIYQCIYVPADALLAIVGLVILAKTGTLARLKAIMQKGK